MTLGQWLFPCLRLEGRDREFEKDGPELRINRPRLAYAGADDLVVIEEMDAARDARLMDVVSEREDGCGVRGVVSDVGKVVLTEGVGRGVPKMPFCGEIATLVQSVVETA